MNYIGYINKAQYFEHTTEIINLMKGHGCVNIHIEETKDKKRIEWCKFIDSLSNGDSAVFASFDNVFHNFHDMMFFIKYCSKMDIRIISISDELDTHDKLFPERTYARSSAKEIGLRMMTWRLNCIPTASRIEN